MDCHLAVCFFRATIITEKRLPTVRAADKSIYFAVHKRVTHICFVFSSRLCDVVHAKSDHFLVCYSRGIGRVCFPGLHYFGEGSTTSRHWYASNSICNRVWGIRNMQSGHVRVTLPLTHRVSVTAGLLPTDLHCLTLRVVNSLPLGL